MYMVIKASLNGLKVLVTRPKDQAQNLCDLITQADGEAIAFPVIEIVEIDDEQQSPLELDFVDMIIFVSRNAISGFINRLKQPLPDRIQLVSVGAGTAQSMCDHGLRVDLQPDQLIGSEGLLLMPDLAIMSGKQVLIVRGQGGRELLADTLKRRGAKVSYLEVYQRILPSPTEIACQQALGSDTIICTSVEGVKNLVLLLQKGLKILHDKPMLVVSERIKKTAVLLGFNQVRVTESASDIDVIELLTKMDKGQWKRELNK